MRDEKQGINSMDMTYCGGDCFGTAKKLAACAVRIRLLCKMLKSVQKNLYSITSLRSLETG